MPGTLLNETQARYRVAMLGELQLIEKKINGRNPAVPRDDEISPSVSRRLARAARYPLDPPAISHFLRLGYWLISKVRVSRLDRSRDSMDLVAASVSGSLCYCLYSPCQDSVYLPMPSCGPALVCVEFAAIVVLLSSFPARPSIGLGRSAALAERRPKKPR